MTKKEQNKKEDVVEESKSCKLPIAESVKKDSMKLKDLLPKSLGMCEECD